MPSAGKHQEEGHDENARALIALVAVVAAASAQTYPSRPVTMMVGFPPGGPTDTLARLLAEGMQPSLGQPVVVETLSGASGAGKRARRPCRAGRLHDRHRPMVKPCRGARDLSDRLRYFA